MVGPEEREQSCDLTTGPHILRSANPDCASQLQTCYAQEVWSGTERAYLEIHDGRGKCSGRKRETETPQVKLLLRIFYIRACLLDAALNEFGLHFGFLSS